MVEFEIDEGEYLTIKTLSYYIFRIFTDKCQLRYLRILAKFEEFFLA